MKNLAKEQKFEEASSVRNQITRLAYITQSRIPSERFLENPNLVEDIRVEELKSLKKILNLKRLRRIECYDVSHLAGVKAEIDKTKYSNPDNDTRGPWMSSAMDGIATKDFILGDLTLHANSKKSK